MRFLSRRRLLFALPALAVAAGCAKPPPKPTLVKVVFNAQANVNPDARGRPSPITVRLYGLKSRAAYDTADFFALYEKDGQTLGGDLVFKEEFQLLPNESKTLDKQLAPEVLYLGLFAAFRDLERSEWRRVATFVPHQVNNLQVLLERSTVTVLNR
jgi:type VI secretion system protein VasD